VLWIGGASGSQGRRLCGCPSATGAPSNLEPLASEDDFWTQIAAPWSNVFGLVSPSGASGSGGGGDASLVVLYDQFNNASTTSSLSATFTDFPTFSSDLVDDFVVPAGQTWNVQSIDTGGVYFNGTGPATSWNVFIYTNNGGFPETVVYSTLNQPVTEASGTFTVNMSPAAVLAAGTYWIEIQANMTFGSQGEWGWVDRTVQSNSPAKFQNPGGGLGVCPTWTAKLTCIPTAGGPDRCSGSTVRAELAALHRQVRRHRL